MKEAEYEVVHIDNDMTRHKRDAGRKEMLRALAECKSAVLYVSNGPEEREWFTLPAENDDDAITVGDVYRALAFYDVMSAVEVGMPREVVGYAAAKYAPPFIARGIRDAMVELGK